MHHRIDDRVHFPLRQVLMIATLIIIAFATWYVLDETLRSSGKDIAWYPAKTSCDLHRSGCDVQLGEHGKLRLALERNKIVPLEPLAIDVRLQDIEAERVLVEFEGRGMDMGLNRFVLEAIGDGHFRGLGQFGVCTREVMPWRIRVLIEGAKGRRLGSWFDIEIQRRS
nr:hypothetical protein [uncultured Halomonas sp.]